MKVVTNTCYGGFGLSLKAIKLFNKLSKGIKIGHFPDYKKKESIGINPKDKHNFKKGYVLEYEIERTNLALVQVVKELGKEANGRCAELKIVEIPDGIKFEIEEYDGVEWISEEHRTWR